MTKGSDWIVTGSVFVDPASLAKRLAADGQLLWEWRPAFLTGKQAGSKSPTLSVRPYTTVAQLPPAFVAAVERKLALSRGQAEELFRELGTRGVGLASLVTMGANKVYGAYGFFLAYRLLDQATRSGTIRLIVPLDAVDRVLPAVCGTKAADRSHRADLLLMEVRLEPERQLTLVPVEIRCSMTTPASFPGARSAQVREKVGQLYDSLDVLQ